MIIANPIYDVVFKYLLDDHEIAKGLLSTILGEEIVELEVKPQETLMELESHVLTVFRLDFKAVIRTAAGAEKKVLIELQKAKKLFDIMRFRRYLADNYQKLDSIKRADEETTDVPLPIVTIYFLGFALKKGYPPVFRVKNCVQNAVTGEELTNRPHEPFVELLNHESYTIQIPLLEDGLQTKLEKVLMVFSPKYRTDDSHKLNYLGDDSDPLISQMLDRLVWAVADEQVRKNMDVEDEIENTIANLLREKDEIIEENRKAIEEKEKTIEEKEKTIEEKEKELAARDALIAELKRKLNLE